MVTAFCSIVASLSGTQNGDRPRLERPSSCSRRDFLQYGASTGLGMTILTALPSKSSAAAKSLEFPELHGLDDTDTPKASEFVNTGLGVRIQNIKEGEGPSVEKGSRVSIQYVLRRSNGYFVDASYGFDRFETYNFTAGSSDVIEGFDIGVRGMKPGGRRRFVVEPKVGYSKGTSKSSPGPIPPDWGNRRALATHAAEPLVFEVQVVKVRMRKAQPS